MPNKLSYPILILFLLAVFLVQAVYIKNTQPLPILGFTPELILEYQAGLNFEKYGFLTHLFSIDYSSSPDSFDHPYIYSHQFNLPAILIGVLLYCKLPLVFMRLFFVLISLGGVVYLFKVIDLVTRDRFLALLLACLSCLYFNESFLYLEHSTHSFYSIVYFGGFYYFIKFIKCDKNLYLYLYSGFLALGLLANTIAVTPLIIATAAYSFFFARRCFLKILLFQGGLVFSFIALMMLRNSIVLGWQFAWQDFLYTLTNRIFSIPSREDLSDLYKDNGVVLWGVQDYRLGFFFYWLKAPFINMLNIFGAISFLPLAYLLYKSDRFKRQYIKTILQILLILWGTYFWHFLFMSYGTNYIFVFLDKATYLILIFLIYLSLLYLKRNWYFESKFIFKKRIFSMLLAGFIFGLFFFVAGNVADQFYGNQFKTFLAQYKTIRLNQKYSLVDLSKYTDKSKNQQVAIATNIDGMVAGFFFPGVIVKGGCNLDALNDKNSGKCLSTFNLKNKNPTHQFILYSTTLIPGHTSCDLKCMEADLKYLKSRYKSISMDIPGFYLFQI